LARVVHWLDHVIPGGPNCYRRALVLVALDPDAADEPFVLGLNVPNTGPRGHAWVERGDSSSAGAATPDRYDVEFRL
jgi:hypothetical protein